MRVSHAIGRGTRVPAARGLSRLGPDLSVTLLPCGRGRTGRVAYGHMHGSMHGDGVINQTKRSSPSRKALVEPGGTTSEPSTTPLASTHVPVPPRSGLGARSLAKPDRAAGGAWGGAGGGWGGARAAYGGCGAPSRQAAPEMQIQRPREERHRQTPRRSPRSDASAHRCACGARHPTRDPAPAPPRAERISYRAERPRARNANA